METRAPNSSKPESIQRMFAEISGSYDFMNSAMTFRLHHRWRRFAVRLLEVDPSDRVLDLCCGTGDFGIALRKVSGVRQIVGMDFCLPMLRVAAKKRSPESLALGDGCNIPLRSASVDAVAVGWGLRNVRDYRKALAEIFRVLKPGGRFVSLDMAVPRTRLTRTVAELTFQKIIPVMGALLGKREAYRYLPKSTQAFFSREQQIEAMRAVGFADVKCFDLFFGNICAHRGVK